MYYEIIPNKFAPKRKDREDSMTTNSHSICYGKCNCNCIFCDFTKRPVSAYNTYDDELFSKAVDILLEKGNNFKFTGGEPTLNPHLEKHLEIVKAKGGYVYLDSNGSNPEILEKLMQKNLIDVLGISLKGIDKEEALITANIKNENLIWNNVWRTLEIANKYSDKVRTIVTLVFTIENREGRLQKFAELIRPFPKAYMKINNLQRDDHPEYLNIHSVGIDSLYNEVKEFVDLNTEWKNRVIFVPGADGVSNYDSIIFF